MLFRSVGESSDWQNVSIRGAHVLALKTNGTIWQWGDWSERSGTNFVRKTISEPTQIGTDTNWIAIHDGWRHLAIKSDGTLWTWGPAYDNKAPEDDEPKLWLQGPVVGRDNTIHPGDIRSLSFNGYRVALVFWHDGSLWMGEYQPRFDFLPQSDRSSIRTLNRRHEDFEDPADSAWNQVTLTGSGFIGVTRDGLLKELNPRGTASPSQVIFSSFSDWVAVSPSSDDPTFFALSREGTLAEWDFRPAHWVVQRFQERTWIEPARPTLLAPSRVKARKIAGLDSALFRSER